MRVSRRRIEDERRMHEMVGLFASKGFFGVGEDVTAISMETLKVIPAIFEQ
jgi:hypothetical protein